MISTPITSSSNSSSSSPNSDSDIDFLVEYAPDAERTLFKAVELKYELEDIIQRKVDVLTEAAISPYIKPYVLKDRRVIM